MVKNKLSHSHEAAEGEFYNDSRARRRARMKRGTEKLLHSNNFIFTFLRSAVSSQTSGYVDLFLSFALFAWCGFAPVWATAIGATAGGIVNCILNYRFTFQSKDCPWRAVIVKYIMVWFGSLLLNSYGTTGLYWLFSRWHWLETIGFKPDGYFAVARLLASLLVSWFWNFVLQRHFVYRRVGFDKYAIRLTRFFYPSRK